MYHITMKKIIQELVEFIIIFILLMPFACGIFAFDITETSDFLVVENGKFVAEISKNNGMVESLHLVGSEFEIVSDFANYSIFFPEFSYQHPDGVGMDYYEPEKDKANVTVSFKKYDNLIVVEANWKNGKINATWQYFFEPNKPYFRAQITRNVVLTGVYSNFQQCTMYNPDMDNSFIINYQGQFQITMGHYTGNKRYVFPVKFKKYYSPFTAQHSLWTVFDYGHPEYFPLIAWRDNESNIHAGVIATWVSPNQRETISYHGGGSTKKHPGFCEAQFNWFGKSDSECLYLRQGTEFAMELYFYQNYGSIDSLLNFSKALLSKNFEYQLPENYVAASWGGNNSSMEYYYWRFPQVSSNYITSQELWRHKSFAIPRSQNGIWDIHLFSLDIISLIHGVQTDLTPNHGTKPLFDQLWTMKSDSSYTGGMSWRVNGFYTKLFYTNYPLKRRVTVSGELKGNPLLASENFIKLVASPRIEKIFFSKDDSLFSFIAADSLLDTVSISLTDMAGIDSFYVTSDTLFLRIRKITNNNYKFKFNLFPSIKAPLKSKIDAHNSDILPPTPYKAHFINLGKNSGLSYFPSSKYFVFHGVKKNNKYSFDLFPSMDFDTLLVAFENPRDEYTATTRCRIKDNSAQILSKLYETNGNKFQIIHHFYANQLYHIELANSSNQMQVSPTSTKSIAVYPNPSSGLVRLDLFSERSSVFHYILYDLSGREVLNSKANISANHIRSKTINLSNHASGLYFLRIISNDNTKVFKIIILK